MNEGRKWCATGLVIGAIGYAVPAQAGDASAPAHPAFSALRVGQLVTVSSAGSGWDIMLLGEGAVGSHRVLELASSHLVLQDIVGVSRSWIPVSAVRSIKWTRIDGVSPDSRRSHLTEPGNPGGR